MPQFRVRCADGKRRSLTARTLAAAQTQGQRYTGATLRGHSDGQPHVVPDRRLRDCTVISGHREVDIKISAADLAGGPAYNAPFTEITVTVSGDKAAGKTQFLERVLRPALKIAGLTNYTVLENDNMVPEFDRVRVHIPRDHFAPSRIV